MNRGGWAYKEKKKAGEELVGYHISEFRGKGDLKKGEVTQMLFKDWNKWALRKYPLDLSVWKSL